MKRVVILGAGFGGLRAATVIAKKLKRLRLLGEYEVILVDKNDHHTYTPLLYEVATTSKETADCSALHGVAAHKIRSLIDNPSLTFIRDEVESLDLTEGDIHLKDGGKLIFDYLVIALGAETNFLNIRGLERHALTLKSFLDAVKIRDAVWNLTQEKRKLIRILIGGGGSTGVELAGELRVWCGELEEDLKNCRLKVTLVEAAPSILAGFSTSVTARVRRRLTRLGAEILEGDPIAAVQDGRVILKSRRSLPYDLLVWAGGVRAPDLIGRLPLKTEARGRVEVVGKMECLPQTPDLRLHGKIYGLGDAVCFYDPVTKKPIPGVARAALSQANVAAWNIVEDIKYEQGFTSAPQHRTYRPMEYPYIIPVGGKYAVAKVGPFVISGFLGWFLKGLVELNYLLSIMSPWRAIKTWFEGLKIFIQNDRLG